MTGKSNARPPDRKSPDDERHTDTAREYLPEFCTEPCRDTLHRVGCDGRARYRAGVCKYPQSEDV